MTQAPATAIWHRLEPCICLYCWRPLVKFLPPANYKGPPSEWTHFYAVSKSLTYKQVYCQTKQRGRQVPRMIPGRLIINEVESVLDIFLEESRGQSDQS